MFFLILEVIGELNDKVINKKKNAKQIELRNKHYADCVHLKVQNRTKNTAMVKQDTLRIPSIVNPILPPLVQIIEPNKTKIPGNRTLPQVSISFL